MICNLDCAVKVKMFGHVSQERGAWHSGARPSDIIVLYCTDGIIHMQVDGDTFRVDAGDILTVPPKALYQPLEGGRCQYYFVHVSATVLSDMTDLPRDIVISPHTGLTDGYAYTCMSRYTSLVRIPRRIKSAPYYMRELFEKAAILKPNKSVSEQLLLDHLMRELLIYMGDTDTPRQDKRLTEMLTYIEQHYSEKLTLSALSERFSLSESYIARLFQRSVSLKPSEYVNRVRISVAQSLLAKTDLTVGEIAEQTGFSDPYYFSKVFKRIVGCSPLQARKSM